MRSLADVFQPELFRLGVEAQPVRWRQAEWVPVFSRVRERLLPVWGQAQVLARLPGVLPVWVADGLQPARPQVAGQVRVAAPAL
ncbi:hypothetical protein GCM10028804_02950 [Larkinella terrae]